MQNSQKTVHFQIFCKSRKLFFARVYHSPFDSCKVCNIEAPLQIWGQLASAMPARRPQMNKKSYCYERPVAEFIDSLKVHKIEIFFGFDFEICIISLLVM